MKLAHFQDSSGVLELQVEKISSLRTAILNLAQKAVDKTDIEKQYVADVVKAQEEERIVREIHTAPFRWWRRSFSVSRSPKF